MPTRIDKLTAAQAARMDEWAQRWIAFGLDCDPAPRATVEDGIRRCYQLSGLRQPTAIVWVQSPLVGAFAGPYVGRLLTDLLAGGGQVYGQVGDQVYGQVYDQVRDQVYDQVRGQVRDQVDDQVDGQVYGQVGDQVDDQVDGQVGGQVGDQVYGQVYGQVGGQVRDQVDDQVYGQVGDQVYGQVRDQVDDQVYGQVGDQVGGQVRGQVYGQVRDQVRGQVRDQVDDQYLSEVDRTWAGYLGGQWWASWLSYYSFFRDVCALEFPGADTWARLDAYVDASTAGWWWPYRGYTIVAERPELVAGEQIAPAGWGSHRLHCETGPAVRWRDGNALYAVHGVQVPASLIETGWTPEQILAEPNAEVRRVAIELRGWDRFIAEAGLHQVAGPVDDPGNPGNTLSLYDVPERIYDEPVRVLLCTNASPERDGTVRRFGLTVPAEITDPVAAAAWTFSLDPSVYKQLERAT